MHSLLCSCISQIPTPHAPKEESAQHFDSVILAQIGREDIALKVRQIHASVPVWLHQTTSSRRGCRTLINAESSGEADSREALRQVQRIRGYKQRLPELKKARTTAGA